MTEENTATDANAYRRDGVFTGSVKIKFSTDWLRAFLRVQGKTVSLFARKPVRTISLALPFPTSRVSHSLYLPTHTSRASSLSFVMFCLSCFVFLFFARLSGFHCSVRVLLLLLMCLFFGMLFLIRIFSRSKSFILEMWKSWKHRQLPQTRNTLSNLCS